MGCRRVEQRFFSVGWKNMGWKQHLEGSNATGEVGLLNELMLGLCLEISWM